MPTDKSRSPALLATVVAVPLALVAGIVTFQLLHGAADDSDRGPGNSAGAVTVSPPPSDAATEVACRALLARLPDNLLGPRRPVRAKPDNGGPIAERVAAWGDPVIALRCGVSRPAALTPTAQLYGVNGVEWVAQERKRDVVWTTSSRSLFVEVTIPLAHKDKASTEILLPLAEPISQTIPPS